MEEYVLGTMETRFAEMIWEAAPITTGELIKRCDAAFGWKRTTTYTMLKRLCVRGLFQLQDGLVTVLYADSPPVQAGGGRHPTSDRRKQEGRELI